MRSLFSRLRDAFRRRKIDRTFDDEMEFHLGELERRFRDAGLELEAARAAARREFGNVGRTREDLRETAGFPTWDELVNDFRFAARGLLRRRWLSGSVVIILALGLGAAAVIFGLVDAIFLRPLPVPRPQEIFAVACSERSFPSRLSRGTVRRLEESLPPNSVAAYGGTVRAAVQWEGKAAAWGSARLVSGDFFPALETTAKAGRMLGRADDSPGAPVTVVTGETWARKLFGSPEAAVGKEITVNRIPVTVVGVLPEEFHDVSIGNATELWLPAAAQFRLKLFGNASETVGDDRSNDPDWNREERISWLQVLVRSRGAAALPGDSVNRAWDPQRQDLIKVDDDPASQARLKARSWHLDPAPGGESSLRDHFRETGWMLGSVAGILLALVCTNVSGLLLVRSMSRHREIGVRLALGAGSFRVVRLGLIEAVWLNLAGGVLGWLLALWLLPAATHLLLPNDPVFAGLGTSSMLGMMGAALACALCSALAPAWWISRVEPLRALTGNRGLGRAPVKLGRALVVAQFALAVSLVALATALGSEMQRVLAADPGFARERVVTAIFDPDTAGYERAKVDGLMVRLREAALGVPGVAGVAFSANGVLAGSQWGSSVYVRDGLDTTAQNSLQHDAVSPGYFGVLGTPVLLGREFTDADVAGAPAVAVVTRSFAQKFFGTASPIGHTLGFDVHSTKDDRVIVGVIANLHLNGVRGDAPIMFFAPAAQEPAVVAQFVAVRVQGSVDSVVARLHEEFSRVDPALVFSAWKTLEQRMADDVRGSVASTRLAAVCGGCAMLLAGAGVAGALGYLVILRQRDLALRIAIGASPRGLFQGVIADSLRLGAWGALVGLVIVETVPRLPALNGVLKVQPGIVAGVAGAGVALLAALVAGSIPARRAARIDPIQILKAE